MRQYVEACVEKARLNARHLGRKLGIVLFDISWEDVGLRIEMIQLLELAAAAFARVAQCGNEKSICIKRTRNLCSGVGYVLAMAILCVVRKSTVRDSLCFGSLTALRVEEGLPVVSDAEDDIRPGKCLIEAAWVIEVRLDQLCTL